MHKALQKRTGTVRYIKTTQPVRTLMPQEHAPRTGRKQKLLNRRWKKTVEKMVTEVVTVSYLKFVIVCCFIH